MEGPYFESSFRPAIEAVLRLCDTDGDGVLSRAEFRTLQEAFGTGSAAIDSAFDRLDADSSGTLEVAELVAAAKQYYTSADPDAPGNWFFGPI